MWRGSGSQFSPSIESRRNKNHFWEEEHKRIAFYIFCFFFSRNNRSRGVARRSQTKCVYRFLDEFVTIKWPNELTTHSHLGENQ